MRVAYICADAGIPVFGCKGASVHIQEVLRALLKKGAEIILFASRIDSPPPPDLAGIQLCHLPLATAKSMVARAEAALAGNEQLVQALQGHGPFDLVYERYSLWSHAGLSFARHQGWKTVLEVNAPLIEEQRNYRELVAEDQAIRVLQRLLDSATAVVAVSPGVKDYLVSFYGSAERMHVIANGVNPVRFTSFSPRKLTQIPSKKVVIGFLGTLKPWHGLTTLVEAFRLLHAQRPQTQLLIVGEGPERQLLTDAFSHLGLTENVIFSGGVNPMEVPGWLAEMDIAIAPYPSLAGFYFSPLKIYEYMAASLPVVTTRVGHLAEVISEGLTGLLVEPDNPAALCEAIRQLVDNPLLCQQLGGAGYQHVITNHSWEAVVGEILQIADVQRLDQIGSGLDLGKKASIDVVYHYYRQDRLAALVDDTTDLDAKYDRQTTKKLGSALDVIVGWRPHKQVKLEGGMAWFAPSSRFYAGSSRHSTQSSSASSWWLKAEVKF